MANPVNGLATRIPQPATSFVDANGGISREWLYYMIAIFNRTGGASGISSAMLQGNSALSLVADAMDEMTFPTTGVTISIDDFMGDQGVAPVANPFLAALLTTDQGERAVVNPFLASLLVADAS